MRYILIDIGGSNPSLSASKTMKEKRKKFLIPNGYSEKDTDNRLDWLKETTGFDYSNDLENQPDDLKGIIENHIGFCLLYTSPSPRD